jgi:hypothetical protein
MHIQRSEIVANLRSRGLDARADWVDKELPEVVDAEKNSGLLSTLAIDPSTMEPVEVSSESG